MKRRLGEGPGGYPKDYVTTLSVHPTLENALHWAGLSGLRQWEGGGRMWVEDVSQRAVKGR